MISRARRAGDARAIVLLLGAACSSGCNRAEPPPAPAVYVPQSSAGPRPPDAVTSASPRYKRTSCAPWDREATLVTASSQAGRADFRRELRYDRTGKTLAVSDADPFAGGTEAKVPRVIERTRPLSPDESARLDAALFAICASEAALKARCAPGGCVQLVVKTAGAEVTVEDLQVVSKAMEVFAPYFPELRRP